jgi:tetratricopeptide (TPR) repeat protein
MPGPRAVVIPFGVPAEGRGLGLGLAALVHAFVHVEGGGVALAQLHARRDEHGKREDGENEDRQPASPGPVEAFVPPSAWNDIARRGETQAPVGVVLTGSFEPPVDGQGTIRLLAFDSRDGRTRAHVDVTVDDAHAGATLVGAFEQLWAGLGGEIGGLEGLRDLGWDSLESVLRAERCALHDPLRGGPHDRLAAMLHLGRAIEEAPEARYPAERLAALALDTTLDAKGALAAVRALERAVDDAPAHAEMVEALAALLLRLGRPRDAERRLNAALAATPRRAGHYPILATALRTQGKPEAALAVLAAGMAESGGTAAMHTERGVVLAELGDAAGAAAAWRAALAMQPLFPPAFGQLAALALRTGDATGGQMLVDAALAAENAHADVLRRAVQLALSTEADGLARAARVARLCERILDAIADDPQASLALARALLVLGDPARARERLAHVRRVAPGSAAEAEAQITRLAIEDPGADRAIQAVVRTARSAPVDELPDIGARARRLATLHDSWVAWLAAAVAERRRGRGAAARGALEVALETAPGATAAHVELAAVLLDLDDPAGALGHAERAMALEGDSPRVLGVLARCLAASGRGSEARAVASRVLAAQPGEPGGPRDEAARVQTDAPTSVAPKGRWRRWLDETFGRSRP